MTQYKSVIVKCSNSQLKPGLKKWTEVTLNRSSNVIGDSHDKTNFPHQLLLTDGFKGFVKLLRIIYQLI